MTSAEFFFEFLNFFFFFLVSSIISLLSGRHFLVAPGYSEHMERTGKSGRWSPDSPGHGPTQQGTVGQRPPPSECPIYFSPLSSNPSLLFENCGFLLPSNNITGI